LTKPGGVKVKRILLIMVALLICSVTARAGELKVMVPVDDYKQMQAKLKGLEEENSQLKQAVNSSAAVAGNGQETAALQSQLSSLEQENTSLRQQLQSQQGQASEDLAARISALEQENSQLQTQLAEKQSPEQMAGGDNAGESRLAEMEGENIQLRQEVRILKEGGVTATIVGDKSTARQFYAKARHVNSFHNFKF
jgi:chromosome segregation ATPase